MRMEDAPTSFKGLAGLSPAKLALVCVDFQNDFCHPNGKGRGGRIENARAAERAHDTATRFIDHGAHVIYTRQEIDPHHLTDRQRQWEPADGLCVAGSWGADLYLPPVPGAHVVTKRRFDVWQSREFTELLAELGIEGLVLAGLELRCCLLYAVMGADERGYRYTVPQDLISGVDAGNATFNRNVRDYLREVHDAPESVRKFLQVAQW